MSRWRLGVACSDISSLNIHMNTYSIWALIKVVVWVAILSIVYRYVNVYDSPLLGLWFWYMGLFMLLRWLGYFLFAGMYMLICRNRWSWCASLSYKVSLLCSICIMVNITLMVNNYRTPLLGLLSLCTGIVLITLFCYSHDHSLQSTKY